MAVIGTAVGRLIFHMRSAMIDLIRPGSLLKGRVWLASGKLLFPLHLNLQPVITNQLTEPDRDDDDDDSGGETNISSGQSPHVHNRQHVLESFN